MSIRSLSRITISEATSGGTSMPAPYMFAARAGSVKRRRAGFTLVEMLTATAVLLAIMGICFTLIEGTNSIWKNTTGKIEGFRNARAAFDTMTRTLSQATL